MASITKNGNGYRVFIRRVGHEPRNKTFPTRREAQRWAELTEAELTHAERFRNTPNTLGKWAPLVFVKDAFERHRDFRCDKRKGGQWEKTRIEKMLREAKWMKLPIAELKPAHIRDWRDERLQKVSPASVNREMNLVSGVLTYALKEWDAPWESNPARAVGRPEGANRARNRRWRQHEIDAICTAGNWAPDRKPVFGYEYVPWCVLLTIETAMRPSEICGLTVADFEPEQRCVLLHDTKNGDARAVPLTRQAVEWFKFLCEGRKPSERIMVLGWQSMGVAFSNLRKKAGLADANIRLRDTRHEAITRLAPKFRNVLELAAVTGHRSLKSLQTYYNPTVMELAARLDRHD